MMRLVRIVMLCITSVFICVICMNDVHAGGWVGSGNGAVGSSEGVECSNADKDVYRYREDCAGTSWIYYKAQSAADRPVQFAPFSYVGNLTTGKKVQIPAICSNNGNGGFWHFGVNAQSSIGTRLYALINSNWNPTLYMTDGDYTWGHWTTVNGKMPFPQKVPGWGGANSGRFNGWNWNIGGLGHKLIGDGTVYYEATEIGLSDQNAYDTYMVNKLGGPDIVSPEELLDNYNAAARAFAQQLGQEYEELNYIPSDVYAFCYWEGIDRAVYAQSTVSAGSDSEDTGIVSNYEGEKVAEASVRSDEPVEIKFSHYLDSAVAVEADWTIEVTETFSTGLTGTVVSGSYDNNEKTGSASLNTKSGEYYAANIANTNYTIKFQGNGTYQRCEVRTAKTKNGSNMEFPLTRVCAKVQVSQSNINYYAQSNVSARNSLTSDLHWKHTDITSNGKAEDVMSDIGKNNDVYVVFSHNIYSSEMVDSAEWSLERPSISSNSNVEIVLDMSCGNSGLARFNSKDYNDKGYYVGEPIGSQRCDDGSNSNNKFIARDIYKVRFKSDTADEIKLCQKVFVKGVQKTEVCAIIAPRKVKDDPDNLCAEFGSVISWRTYTISRVRNTSVSGMDSWDSLVYAKPGDTVAWVHCYYPGVQLDSNTTVSKYDPPHSSTVDGCADSYRVHTTMSKLWTWENYFRVTSSGGGLTYGDYQTFDIGDANVQWSNSTSNSNGNNHPNRNSGVTPNSYLVTTVDDSEILAETIKTGSPSNISIAEGTDHGKWACNRRCDSSACGTHPCNCVPVEGGGMDCDDCCNTCSPEECYHGEDYIWSNADGTASSSADVYVPYNFITSASVTLGDDLVYAGEKTTIESLSTTISTKYNGTTNGTYATQSDDAKIKLVAYVSSSNRGSEIVGTGSGRNYDICNSLGSRASQCAEIDVLDGVTLNSKRYTSGASDTWQGKNKKNFDENYNIFDAEAGDYYCVVAAVYPHTSGGDKNMSLSGSNRWYISEPDCAIIAKEPSFQVWGGSVYSENAIKTSVSEKNNLRDLSNSTYIYPYSPFANGSTIVFGSWAEQSVVANGAVTGFASGAASDGTGSIEGTNPSYCNYRVPLSFANNGTGLCPNSDQTGESGISVSTASREALVNYWWVMDAQTIDQEAADLAINYVNSTNLNGDALRYVYSNGDIYLTSSEKIGLGDTMTGVTYVVRADGNITIAGDIEYIDENDTMLSSSKMIPKVIIYAAGNINIKCSVNRIDAVLVTNGYVNTCGDLSSVENPNDNINDSGRSNQLTINGAIMANRIYFNRTYGAGAGAASGVPAEIVNYDVSAILWGREMAEANDFETMTTVYQYELAPRY